MQEAQTAPGVFPVRESEQWLIVRNGMIELGFSKSNGQLGYVADAVSGRVVMGSRESSFQSVELQEGGRLIPLPPNYPHFYTDQPQEVQTWGRKAVISAMMWSACRTAPGSESLSETPAGASNSR
ncbi:MAG: hypothetical protein V8T87_09450 [Victivallales bacterium]